MIVGQLVHETIMRSRIYACNHSNWAPINNKEEQCKSCGVIATQEGKENLKRIKEGKGLIPAPEIRYE